MTVDTHPDRTHFLGELKKDASDAVKVILHGMSLILKAEACDGWFNPDNPEPSKTEQLLMKGHVKELCRYPVSKLVNQVGYNKRECMEPMKGIIGSKALAGGPKKA